MSPLSHHSLTMATALIATVGLAGCGGSDGPLPAETAASPTAIATSTAPADPRLAGLVGPGCAEYVAKLPRGAASVAGMANVPLATAARRSQQLTSLSAAVSGKLNPDVDLNQTLNGGQYTVFAPVDAAFAALPAATMAELKTDRLQLVNVVTNHLLQGRLAPAQLTGKQTSVEGSSLTVAGSGDSLTVNGAQVICGGISTANATVYLIDKVLIPAD
jgi:uncharacterized surface protein with fasciclin (FAS1) repeats